MMDQNRAQATATPATGLAEDDLHAIPEPGPGRTGPETPTEITGTAGGTLDLPGLEGDRVAFTIDAHGKPGDCTGTFQVTHVRPDGALFGEFDGTVDWVTRDGDLVIVTGIVENQDLPALPEGDLIGHRVGISIRDVPGGQDKIGWSWAVVGFDQELPRGTGTIPSFQTTHGDYIIRDAS